MTSPKWRIAAAIKRFPFVLTVLHTLVRLTRPRFTAGVTGVLFNSLGEVLIVEHVYHAYPQWGLPGGYVDRGEEPHEAIAREMREELTLPVDVGRVLLVERAARAHVDIAYLCHSNASVGALSAELLDYRWVIPDQLPALRRFHRKAISEALTLMETKV